MTNKLFLVVREPESLADCDILEISATSSRVKADLELLEAGKLSTALVAFLLAEYPEGIFVEGFGAEDYNEGVFIEKTIPLLH